MNIPTYLYKYRSLKTKNDKLHTGRILTHNEIYFAKYTEFNDPFDCRLHVSAKVPFEVHKKKFRELNPDLSESKVDAQTRADLHPDSITKREKKIRADLHRINKKAGIFSMSAIRDNLLMWSHYADSHRGICLEFEVTNGKLFGCDLSEVIYQETYPKLTVCDEINFEFVKTYMTTKSFDWSHEKEWRIIIDKKTGCQVFPSDELSGVILGARISKSKKNQIEEWISKRNSKVQLYQARECTDRFGLDIIPVKSS
jgi:hypothetical protein